jgi:hypothetical protein
MINNPSCTTDSYRRQNYKMPNLNGTKSLQNFVVSGRGGGVVLSSDTGQQSQTQSLK